MSHPECTTCRYKEMEQDGGWCYMFKEQPVFTCMIPERDKRREERIRKAEHGEAVASAPYGLYTLLAIYHPELFDSK